MKNINRERLLISFMILAAIATFCGFILFVGVHESNWITKTLAAIYSLLAFPNIILWKLRLLQNWVGFILGVCTGALFWSVVIEMILIKFTSNIKHPDPEM